MHTEGLDLPGVCRCRRCHSTAAARLGGAPRHVSSACWGGVDYSANRFGAAGVPGGPNRNSVACKALRAERGAVLGAWRRAVVDQGMIGAS